MANSGNARTVEGAGACWYRHPDGSERMALLGDEVVVADSDVERFDRFNVAPEVVPLPNADLTAGDLVGGDPKLDNPNLDHAEESGEPPRSGAGSSRGAWDAYARSRGVSLDDEATRDQIIAAIDALKD